MTTPSVLRDRHNAADLHARSQRVEIADPAEQRHRGARSDRKDAA